MSRIGDWRARRLRERIAALEAELGLEDPDSPLRLEVWRVERDDMLRYRLWWRGEEVFECPPSRYLTDDQRRWRAYSMREVLRNARKLKQRTLKLEAERAKRRREADEFGVRRVTL